MEETREEHLTDRILPRMRVVDEVRKTARQAPLAEHNALVPHDDRRRLRGSLDFAFQLFQRGEESVQPLLGRVLLEPEETIGDGTLEGRSWPDDRHRLRAGPRPAPGGAFSDPSASSLAGLADGIPAPHRTIPICDGLGVRPRLGDLPLLSRRELPNEPLGTQTTLEEHSCGVGSAAKALLAGEVLDLLPILVGAGEATRTERSSQALSRRCPTWLFRRVPAHQVVIPY